MAKTKVASNKKSAKKSKGAKKKSAKKNSLVANINRRKKKGISRSKKNSSVSKKAYQEMEQGWPDKK